MLATLYRYSNLLSLDVAAGAVCGALFFSRLLQVGIRPAGLISLGLTVWIIYTCDHLLDARSVKAKASTRRHLFHQVNFRWLVWVVCIATVADAVIIFFIRRPVFFGGVALAGAVSIYLLVHRYAPFFKEVFIAVLYTMGVLLPSASVTPLAPKQWPWLLILQFGLTALINLLVFSWFDHARDVRDGSVSLVTRIGAKAGRVCIVLLFAVVFLLAPAASPTAAVYVLLVMNIVLLIIFLCPRFFSKDDRFRLLGDAIFFMPLAYYLYYA